MFSDELSHPILYDCVRFVFSGLICFLDDRICLIVYDQVGIITAVLVRFVSCDSCKISAGIFQSESYEIFKKRNT